ncbi:SMP-30/gluconolactonase/LRE family protein [Desertifilum sp. FACHB-1129]|uniref:Gluconolaconase n=3 Tax=Cyanophyceae TaxID=3028117 RepID=A0A1E5QNB1_9CYAN|nr:MULTISPECIES: SMP-30/gluconolactonase/LRE family protein [Cyanophyceae]MDA0213089.1 SMP-30/gluconolactonase/LRE family protein [Cyanobacteria bacterium FC1]MDI9635882.1 SMP-30/gluconolactonase/LRE family protein [Geitlerinema splendidum]MDK3155164.1 SMP-30/gluconolactonase/LRE family protein [Kamptonema cortianum]MDL5048334.1 SMP-30/gluconolactonase/LRE family protein [Oscillatoria amoena NRMC-F 0135]MBD2312345.1 SMP-30/gluconolactonase/LRE family protein [Desertifilum sp. FACHB-1129]
METPKLLVDCQCKNAEGPLWHPQEQRLYWSDIPQGRLFRYDPKTQTSEQIYQGESVGGFTIQQDGSLLLFKTKGTIERWKDGKITTLFPEIPEEQETRFNDVIADPVGRVFCGTMPAPDRLGRLYCLDLDGLLTLVLDELNVSNGMAFSQDRRYLYHTESEARIISRLDYEIATASLSNRQVVLTTPEDEGVPDGMTLDAEGYIWSARWNGGHLFRYAPDGTEVMRIPFPAKKVTSVTFGGPEYTDMFVTTAGADDRANEGEGAGAVFHLNLGIQGVPEFLSQISV